LTADRSAAENARLVTFPHGPRRTSVPDHEHDHDTRMLHALGYAQELRRGMSGFSNFAISFTIISILSGNVFYSTQ
jgi:hypothetical protein